MASVNFELPLGENVDSELDDFEFPIPDEVVDEKAWQRPMGFTMDCKVGNSLLMRKNKDEGVHKWSSLIYN